MGLSSLLIIAAVHGAFAYPMSITQGDNVGIYVSATDSVSFRIQRKGDAGFMPGWDSEVVYVALASSQVYRDSSYYYGTGWTQTYSLATTTAWESGFYSLRVHEKGTSTSADLFAVMIVKEDTPGSTSKILVQLPLYTWEAYNDWGGASTYGDSATINIVNRTHKASMKRPFRRWSGRSKFFDFGGYLVDWLELDAAAGNMDGVSAIEYCTGMDIPTIGLSNYNELIVLGHDEYWENTQRDSVDAFVRSGGNMFVASGNTCWWQVRIESDTTMVCYKDFRLDPIGVDSLVTDLWHDDPVVRPANSTTGLNYNSSWNGVSPTDWVIKQPSHWIFDGTGLAYGDSMGHKSATCIAGNGYCCSGDELDGVILTNPNGIPIINDSDAPKSMTILALAETGVGLAGNRYGAMTEWRDTGTVITCPMRRWGIPLADGNVTVVRITRNIVGRLSKRLHRVPGLSAGGAGSGMSLPSQ